MFDPWRFEDSPFPIAKGRDVGRPFLEPSTPKRHDNPNPGFVAIKTGLPSPRSTLDLMERSDCGLAAIRIGLPNPGFVSSGFAALEVTRPLQAASPRRCGGGAIGAG